MRSIRPLDASKYLPPFTSNLGDVPKPDESFIITYLGRLSMAFVVFQGDFDIRFSLWNSIWRETSVIAKSLLN